jgi:hypothetical protein
MLASAHSVSEKGAPMRLFPLFAKGALDYVGAFALALMNEFGERIRA